MVTSMLNYWYRSITLTSVVLVIVMVTLYVLVVATTMQQPHGNHNMLSQPLPLAICVIVVRKSQLCSFQLADNRWPHHHPIQFPEKWTNSILLLLLNVHCELLSPTNHSSWTRCGVAPCFFLATAAMFRCLAQTYDPYFWPPIGKAYPPLWEVFVVRHSSNGVRMTTPTIVPSKAYFVVPEKY